MSTNPDLRYRAFICYSQTDRVAAQWLHRRLENFPVPPRLAGTTGRWGTVPAKLAPIFRDREELSASADIGERLKAALATSEFLIVLCSPAAAQSRWVNAEIEAFRTLHPENRERVLAVILAGEPLAADAGAECFPGALRSIAGEAGALDHRVPLAADFRKGKDGRREAELRLIAALLGVEFAGLKSREQERRVRSLRRWTVAAAALALALAGLAGYTLRQRRAAEAATARALTARAEAEKLVDYMLTELRPKLEVLGKLELLEPANEKVRDYYRSVALGDQNLDVLRRRAMAFRGQAVDLLNHKKGEATLVALGAELVLRERIVELAPRDMGSWLELGETQRMISFQRRDSGDLAGALSVGGLARKHTARAMEIDSGNLRGAARLASLVVGEGELLIRLGRTADARVVLEESWRMFQELVVRDASNLETKNRAAAAAWQLGNVCRREGDFAAAEPVYRRAVELARELHAAEPKNIYYLRRLELSVGTLGQMFLEAGRHEEAAVTLRENLENSRMIVAIDPENLGYLDGLATQLVNLGEALAALGRHAEALVSIREVIELRERALARGANDVRTRNMLALALAQLSTIEAELNHAEAAMAAARRGVDFMRELSSSAPGDVRLADDLGYLRSKFARALFGAERWGEAETEYRGAIANMEAVIARDPGSSQRPRWKDRAIWLHGLASTLKKRGATAEARRVGETVLAEFDRLEKAGLPASAMLTARQQTEELLRDLPKDN